jgi:hypothetical protein
VTSSVGPYLVLEAVDRRANRAFLAIGMAGAYWRSEQVALRVEDIARDDRGLRIEQPPMATTRDRE